jgi:probable HAF family extracellular repeat protein
MIPRTLAAAFAATLFLASAPGAGAAPLYTLTVLPTDFSGVQLNDAGQVVGTAGDAAAIYFGGVVTSVAPSISRGDGINNAGHVTGSLNDFYISEAFTSIGGTVTSLHSVVTGNYGASFGTAINDNGVVAGNVYEGGEHLQGFILHDGIVEHIGTFGNDYSPINAINNSGVATGYSGYPGPVGLNYFHAFIYQNGTLQDIGTLDGIDAEYDSAGNDINDLGQVAGWSGTRPFLYSGGSMLDLGALGAYGGYANALNEDAVVVGYSASSLTPGGTVEHGFLWDDGAIVDLNTLLANRGSWEITNAQDINEAGQILGTACLGGSCASVLLTPVPEPATGVMLLAGLGVLATRGRGRRQRTTGQFSQASPA